MGRNFVDKFDCASAHGLFSYDSNLFQGWPADLPMPVVGDKYIDWYDLYIGVHRNGGYKAISSSVDGWTGLTRHFGIAATFTNAPRDLKALYDKNLLPYDEFRSSVEIYLGVRNFSTFFQFFQNKFEDFLNGKIRVSFLVAFYFVEGSGEHKKCSCEQKRRMSSDEKGDSRNAAERCGR